MTASLTHLGTQIESCRRCPRLRTYCETVAREKRRAYASCDYWGKPVPGFGDPNATLWIVGLAPGGHAVPNTMVEIWQANAAGRYNLPRDTHDAPLDPDFSGTGRVFTGDRSGDFLFAALHRAGFANQPTSKSPDDGLTLRRCYISAAVRCAPPGNKPMPMESKRCAPFLDAEWKLLEHKRVILALGKIAWDAVIELAMANASSFTPTFA